MSAAKKIGSNVKDCVHEFLENVSSMHVENFAKQTDSLGEGSTVILDFNKVKAIEISSYSALQRLKNNLQKKKISFSSTNIQPVLLSKIKNDGALSVFNVKSEKINNKKIDVRFVTPFVNATLNALKVQASIEAKCKAPYLKENQAFSVDIAGVISLVSDAFVGSISLCFPQKTFLKICYGLFGEESNEINNEIQDAAGELLNMIFGAAKAEINANHGFEIKRALPTVIVGNSLKLKQSSGPTIVLPFESSVGEFHLEIEVVDK